jgi:hypothetical protein
MHGPWRDFHTFTLPLAPVTRRSTQKPLNPQSARSLRILRVLRSTVVTPGNAKPAKPAKKNLFCVLCGLCVLFSATSAAAHPAPFSYVDLRLRPDAIEGSLVLHIFDAAHDLNITPVERLLDASVAAQQSAALANLMAGRFTVTADGRILTPQWSGVEVLADRQALKFRSATRSRRRRAARASAR